GGGARWRSWAILRRSPGLPQAGQPWAWCGAGGRYRRCALRKSLPVFHPQNFLNSALGRDGIGHLPLTRVSEAPTGGASGDHGGTGRRGLMEALYWVVVMFAIIGAVVLFGTLTSGGARRAGPASGRRRESWWASGDGGGGSAGSS